MTMHTAIEAAAIERSAGTVAGAHATPIGWRDASGLFSPTELRVIALAAGSPGDCATCAEDESWIARASRRIARIFALHAPAPLANPRLEALRLLACSSFTGRKRSDWAEKAAQVSGLSERQIEAVRELAASWRRARV